MSELGKQFLKKSDTKTIFKIPHVNKKPLSSNENLVHTKKLGLELTTNGLGKPFKKKSDPKN